MQDKGKYLAKRAEPKIRNIFTKVLEDDHAREMAASLHTVGSGQCADLEAFGCADECYSLMRDEFRDYCEYLMETEDSIAKDLWEKLTIDEQISVTLSGTD